jgi:2-dehydropantoate 2-reductase
MKIAMMGAGGVGGYYGGRLAQAGHEVFFIARGAHADAMRRDGLEIDSEHGAAHLRNVNVVADPQEVGAVDLIFIAVKLWDTAAAARAVLPMVGADTAVVSLQNGIDKDDEIAAVVGRQHVLGGLTYINAVITAPGRIKQTGKVQRVIVGEFDGSLSPRATAIGAALSGAGIDAEVTADIRRAIWEKFVFLSAHSATTAATREPVGKVRSHPATRQLLEGALREGAALARAEGIQVADDFVAGRMAFIDTMPAEARASMANDLARGNRLELDFLSGAIVRRAEQYGLATPVHRDLYAALVLHIDGAGPAGAAKAAG